MGKEYLTEGAVFACSQGMRFSAEETLNHKAKHNGQKLLTTAAILRPAQPPIPCPLPPPPIPPGGPPPPCPCTVKIASPGVKHRATGRLLLDDVKVLCLKMQELTVKKSGVNGHVVYGAASSPSIPVVAMPQTAKNKPPKAAASDTKPSGQAAASASIVPSAISGASKTFNPKENKGATASRQKNDSPASATEQEPTFDFLREGMLCSCSKNKPECLSCAYRLDNEDAAVDNNSATLRKNYNASKPHTDSYDLYFDNEVEPLGASKPSPWRYAAHHLISGNQVFKQNAELVRLAHFCGYDINACENCIMLVGYPEDYPSDGSMKSVKAYDVMSEGRVQWHVGGHSYAFTAEEKAMIAKQIGIRNKIKISPADIKTYAELAQAEIGKLKQRLENKKNRRQVCYLEEGAKGELRAKLNRISQNIKAKLAAFTDVGKPHHSFPYFVSKEAYRYTYALPRAAKIVTVLQEDGRLTLNKYRVEHFTEAIADKEKSLVINHKGEITCDLSAEQWKMECIAFCDNVNYFVYLAHTPRNVLPFAVEAGHKFTAAGKDTNTDGLRFLAIHDTEILVWLRDNPPYGYTSPAAMVKKRLAE